MPFYIILLKINSYAVLTIIVLGLYGVLTAIVLPFKGWRKGIKASAIIMAWIGLVVLLGGTVFSFLDSFRGIAMAIEGWRGTSLGQLGYVAAFFFSGIGMVLVFIAGLLTRPKYFGKALFAVGIIYVISFTGSFLVIIEDVGEYERLYVIRPHFPEGIYLVCILPGIVAIIEGIIISYLRKRQLLKSSVQIQNH